ncbi:MAG: hypothetical protein C0609_02465 [Deltaproteobacteria bacterium]|nr:MAG: hypothetical protein C0609_02465 [Deltaproteobacteria bacterium]
MERDKARIIAVARNEDRARQIAELVNNTSYSATHTCDLVGAFFYEPGLLIIDPTSWESSCRLILEEFEKRETPPPAVYFIGGGLELIFAAGPALGVIRDDEPSFTLGEKIRMALAAQRIFASSWKRLKSSFEEHFMDRTEKILLERTGVRVREDRLHALRRAIFSRGVARLSNSPQELERCLADPAGELDLSVLVTRVVAPETYFWRYSGQMNALKKLLKERREESGGKVKVLCAGCSTGEEVYSVALAIIEAFGDDFDFHVWGTDINLSAIEIAKRRRYSSHSVRNLPERFIGRWILQEEDAWVVSEELARRVTFEGMNLIGGETERWLKEKGQFDAVFCRNVTIYFDPAKTRLLHERLTSAILSGGGYFLGSSEMLLTMPDGFTPIHESGSFYYLKSDVVSAVEEEASLVDEAAELEAKVEDSYRRGLVSLAKEDLKGAKEAFGELERISPEDPRSLTGRAVLLSNEGRDKEAREKLLAALEAEDTPAEAFFLAGLLEERAGHDSDALAMYGMALGQDNTFFMAHINRAWILRRRGRSNAFKKEMEAALEMLGRSPKKASWATGGLGFDTILRMVADALKEESR